MDAAGRKKTAVWGTIHGIMSQDSIVEVEIFDYSSIRTNRAKQEYIKVKNGELFFEFAISNPVYLDFKKVTFKSRVYDEYSMVKYKGIQLIDSRILVEPGDSLRFVANVETDFSNVGKNYTYRYTQFNGKGSDKQNLILEVIKEGFKYDNPKALSFVKNSISLADSLDMMLVSAIKLFEGRLSKSAFSILKAQIMITLGCDISMNIRNMNLQDTSVQSVYFRHIKASNKLIDWSDPNLKYCTDYIDMILAQRAAIEYAINNNVKFQGSVLKVPFKKQSYDALLTYMPNGFPKWRFLSYYLYVKISQDLSSDLVVAIKNYLVSKYPFHEVVESSYKSSKAMSDSKTQAFSFSLLDTTGAIVKLSDFKGKVVLLDFMFTNCPGCIQMTPLLSALEKEFSDTSKVKFVSISIEREVEQWKKGIGKASPAGAIQLYTNGLGVDHPIIKFYQFYSYPQLILIDKEGYLACYRAPDPRKDKGKELSALIKSIL